MEKRISNKKRFLLAGILFLIVLFLQNFVIKNIPYTLARIPYLVSGLFSCFYFIVMWIAVLYRQVSNKKLILRGISAAIIFIGFHIICNIGTEYTAKAFYESELYGDNNISALFEAFSLAFTACVPLLAASALFYGLRPIKRDAKLYAVGTVFGYILLCFFVNRFIPHNPFSDFDGKNLNSVMDLFSIFAYEPPKSYIIWQKLTGILTALVLFSHPLVLMHGKENAKTQTD